MSRAEKAGVLRLVPGQGGAWTGNRGLTLPSSAVESCEQAGVASTLPQVASLLCPSLSLSALDRTHCHSLERRSAPWDLVTPANQSGSLLCYFSAAASNKLPQTYWLKTIQMYYLTGLEFRCLKSRCWHSRVLSRGFREESVCLAFLSLLKLPASLGSWPLFHMTPNFCHHHHISYSSL